LIIFSNRLKGILTLLNQSSLDFVFLLVRHFFDAFIFGDF